MTSNLSERNRLREMLIRYFSEGELQDLSFRLGIDYENLAGPAKKDKARELIEFAERRTLLGALLAACRELRPAADWPEEAALADSSWDTEERRPVSRDRPGRSPKWLDGLNLPFWVMALVAACVVLSVLALVFFAWILPALQDDTQEAQAPTRTPTSAVVQDTPAPATRSTPVILDTPVRPTPTEGETSIRIEVQTVRVEFGGGARGAGFFAANGYVLAFLPEDVSEATVSWRRHDRDWEAAARVVKRGRSWVPEQLVLLQLVDGEAPQIIPPVRSSVSLQVGEFVERFLGQNDTTPGTVVEVGADNSAVDQALLTTRISFAGDSGSPVLDDQGRVVAVVWGYSTVSSQTISVPVERIKLEFPEAF